MQEPSARARIIRGRYNDLKIISEGSQALIQRLNLMSNKMNEIKQFGYFQGSTWGGLIVGEDPFVS